MKTLISIFAVLALLLATSPSFATWNCKSSNARGVVWYYYAHYYNNARNGALSACTQSGNTYNANTCHIISCWQD